MIITNGMAKPARSANARPRGETTRAALIAAALDLFAAKGFEAASTRAIATAAGANIAAIAYHFGGKEGLRTACADFIATMIGEIFGVALGAAADPSLLTRVEARDGLARVVEGLVDTIVARGEAGPIVRFMLREMFEPSTAFERLFRAIAPLHRRACAIWSRATGAPAESEATRLALFALIGQVIYFRLALPVVLRRMNWRDVGPVEAAAIKQRIVANLDASLEAIRGIAT
jgi:AcrR family transcriptional regulator